VKTTNIANHLTALVLGLAAAFQATSALAQEPTAQPAMPAAVIAGTTRVSAVVEAVDAATRAVTLQTAKGDTVTITAGPEVRNFDQIQPGDRVEADYYEALALVLEKGGPGVAEKVETVEGAQAETGDKPAGVITTSIDAVAVIMDIDRDTRMVFLKGPEGGVTLKIPESIDLDQFSVGDEVRARYEESIAIAVVEQ